MPLIQIKIFLLRRISLDEHHANKFHTIFMCHILYSYITLKALIQVYSFSCPVSYIDLRTGANTILLRHQLAPKLFMCQKYLHVYSFNSLRKSGTTLEKINKQKSLSRQSDCATNKRPHDVTLRTYARIF